MVLDIGHNLIGGVGILETMVVGAMVAVPETSVDVAVVAFLETTLVVERNVLEAVAKALSVVANVLEIETATTVVAMFP